LTEEFIQENFSEYGQLEYVKLLYKGGKPKGMAFVKYTTVSGASNAVKTVNENEDMVGTVPVKVSIAEPQKGKRQKRRRDNNTPQQDQNNTQKRSSNARQRKSSSQSNERFLQTSGNANNGSRKPRFNSNTMTLNNNNNNIEFQQQRQMQYPYQQAFHQLPAGNTHHFHQQQHQVGLMQLQHQGFVTTPSPIYYYDGHMNTDGNVVPPL